MKKLIKILFLVMVVCSCGSNDDCNTEPIADSCFTTDLDITDQYANPYPDHVATWDYFYSDWEWTMKNDSTLCISFVEFLGGSETVESRYCLYYSIDAKNNCATLTDAKIVTNGETIVVIDGIVTLPMWNFFETDRKSVV